MNFQRNHYKYFQLLLLILILGCKPESRFKLLSPESTGVHFINHLEETPQMNVFTYMYFYNGGGVAAGDLNGDHLPDLYFTSNLDSNRLYLNRGNLNFEDITIPAGVAGKKGWTTGVTLADVNADGLLDIYVSQLGDYKNIVGKNQLYINLGPGQDGIPVFEDQAHQWGLDLKGFSTQAAFFDYDLDGDLDLYMLNHSVHSNGTFKRADIREKSHPLAGDKMMRNDGDHFTDVTDEAGIYNSALGYGLGVGISDFNRDGYPDIYVGNDFHEDDYLYYNNGDGTFTESLGNGMAHTSRYSMGNDISDINNDGWPDLVSLDMLPSDPSKLKTSATEDSYDIYHLKLGYGYKHQYTRNTLQLNRGNGKFSEIGQLSGVYATDWSWSALFADFDLDGFYDLFISNGIKRRLNDLDYINYISNETVQHRLEGDLSNEDLALVEKMPVVKVPNVMFRYQQNLQYEDVSSSWGFDQPSFSNGSAYADLDDDGDLDLVTNNIDQPAFIYENQTITPENQKANFLKVRLYGGNGNRFGIGTRVIIPNNGQFLSKELYATRGFQSAVNPEMVFGLGDLRQVDSLIVIWPDHSFQVITNVEANQVITLDHKLAKGSYDFKNDIQPVFNDVTGDLSLSHRHRENDFIEFNREALIPHMSSTEGPAIEVADFNNDGQEDFWIAGAKLQPSTIFIQENGRFRLCHQKAFLADSISEAIAAESLDFDQDGDLDLVVLNGGNEFWGEEEPIRLYAYENNGNGNFTRNDKVFPALYLNGSCLASEDFDQDGDQDLFVGGHVIPWHYGSNPRSYLLRNNGNGGFTEVTNELAAGLGEIGMVKDAKWADLNLDGFVDLVLAGEWMPVTIFMNKNGTLQKQQMQHLDELQGWWNSIEIADLDQNGYPDILAGNLGLNTRLKASIQEPVSMLIGDFNKNGKNEQLLIYFINGEPQLLATRDELVQQLPDIKTRFGNYAEFARADLVDILTEEKIKSAREIKVTEFRSGVFYNREMQFEFVPFPEEAQFSPVHSLKVADFDHDGDRDVLAAGNFYAANIQLGRYDAGLGVLMTNDDAGNLKTIPNTRSGLSLRNQVRDLQMIRIGLKPCVLVANNNDLIQVLDFNEDAVHLLTNIK